MAPSPQEILSRALSLRPDRSYGSQKSPPYEGDPTGKPSEESSVGDWETCSFRKIGFGQCGLVFTVPDQPGTVAKIARPHFGESLYADFLAHRRVEEVFLLGVGERKDTGSSGDLSRRAGDEKGDHHDAMQWNGVQLPRVFHFLPRPGGGPDAYGAERVGVGGSKGEGVSTAGGSSSPVPNQSPSPVEWWDSHLSLFPSLTAAYSPSSGTETSKYSTFHLPSEVLFTEYIPPLSQAVRDALIDLYCFPESKQAAVRADPANRDCLPRVYLGRRRAVDHVTGQPKLVRNFGLRNYNLHLDQMLELGLDVHVFAAMMGRALADVHWGAGVDAFDVEFVLGGRRRGRGTMMMRNENTSENHREADLWLLDFNLCSRFEVDQLVTTAVSAGDGGGAEVVNTDKLDELVEHLVYAFFANDPYYPRPRTQEEWDSQQQQQQYEAGKKNMEWEEGDILLWDTFAKAYLHRADGVLLRSRRWDMYGHLRDLPERFIRTCVEKQKTLPPGVDKIGVD